MRTDVGWTALMCAAEGNKHGVVSILKQKEARMQTSYGLTALLIAATSDYISIVTLLIKKEQRMKTTKSFTTLISRKKHTIPQKSTALYFARLAKSDNVIKILSKYSDERN